jgi:hypothetical protein
MSCLIAAVFLCQAKAELKPKFDKFDKIALSCTVQTEVKASNGRDSKYKLEMDLNAEVEKAEGETVVFDCGASRLKLSGTLEGKTVIYEWKKGAGGNGDKVGSVERALEKGWKATLSGKKGLQVDDAASDLGDTLPVLNPGVFVGLSVLLPFDAVAAGKGWTVKDLAFPYYNGFGLRYAGSLNAVDGNTAKISAKLSFTKPENEIPIDGVVNVKGEGDASLDYDLKSGRPLRGATSVKVSFGQGGLKKEVTQVVEFEVRR